MPTATAHTLLERRLKSAAVLVGLISVAIPVDWNLDGLYLWNLVVSAAIYAVPGLTVLYALLRRRSWARRAGLIVSGVWLVLGVAGIATATWWFSGHPNGVHLWTAIFQPMLMLVVPAAAILVLLRPREMHELLSPGHRADS